MFIIYDWNKSLLKFYFSNSILEKYEFVEDIRTLAQLHWFIWLMKSIGNLAIFDWQLKYLTV